MTGGSARLSVSLRLVSRHRPLNGRKDSPVTVAEGVTRLLGYGTGSGKFDTAVATARTIPAGGTLTLDLYASTTFLDLNGFAAPLRAVKVVLVWVESGGDASGVRVGGAGSTPWVASFADTSDKALIYPDGPAWAAGKPAGVAVTSTARNLLLENLGAAAVDLGIYVAGSKTGSGGEVFGLPGMTYP